MKPLGDPVRSLEKTRPVNKLSRWLLAFTLERNTRIYYFILAAAVIFLGFAFFMIAVGIRISAIQPLLMAGCLFIGFLLCLFSRNNLWIKSPTRRVFLILGWVNLSMIIYALFFSGITIQVSVMILITSFLIASIGLEDKDSGAAITIGLLSAMLCALIGTYPPIQQLTLSFLINVATGRTIFLLVGFGILMLFRPIMVSLRIKIILVTLIIVLVPISIVTLINTANLRRSIQEQTRTAMLSSGDQLAGRIDEFIKTNRASIATEALLPLFGDYLKKEQSLRKGSQEEIRIKNAFDSIRASLKVKERAYIASIALLDNLGTIFYSSNPYELRMNESDTDYFDMPRETGHVYYSPVEFSPVDKKPYIYISQIVRDRELSPIGVLRIKYDAYILQSYAKEYYNTLGNGSYPILLDENYTRLAEPAQPDLLFKGLNPLPDEKINQLQQDNRLLYFPGAQIYTYTNLPELSQKISSYKTQPFFTSAVDEEDKQFSVAVTSLTSQPWLVVFLQDQATLINASENQIRLTILIATLLAGTVSLLSTLLTRWINTPISQLTETAQQISSGNLAVKSTLTRNDEFGILGNAFNHMTAQIQHLVAELEDRVNERTQELTQQNQVLRYRTRQFETVADVARDVARSQELENLLTNVTQLVSERFGFYHAGIFLLDAVGEYAILRAASSEGGQRMLARQHKLKIGQTGIVGYVTSTGQPRIATDVGADAVYFNNPDLPMTRSEMALPLKAGDQIIGALDVQSTKSDAFTEEDIQLFTILADQVAIGIYNNLLFAETNQALQEAQLVHQRYLQQAWSHEVEENSHSAYKYDGQNVLPVEQNAASIWTDETLISMDPHQDGSALIIPVKLRGETIGQIRIQKDEPDCKWAEEEIETVQSVADQVALALENARLFTQTSRRAERERKVLEITSKIRATTDPQKMLQIAVEELQQALKASRAQVILQAVVPENEHSHTAGNGNGNSKL